MRPSQYLFNAAKKSSGFSIPVELTPLFVAMGIAVASAGFFSYRKFAYDGTLRLKRNPAQSHDSLTKLLTDEKASDDGGARVGEKVQPGEATNASLATVDTSKNPDAERSSE